MNGAPYGYCPHCGAPGIARERRIGGYDRCAKGHDYPSLMAVPAPEDQTRVLPNGSEFAPSIVVGYVTERGSFYATLDAVPMITLHNGERVKVANVEAVRRLSCDEPDDMRAIWRLAALALGESDVRARSAVMVRDHRGLHLVIAASHENTWLWTAPSDRVWSIGNSTAALCAHVWGPK